MAASESPSALVAGSGGAEALAFGTLLGPTIVFAEATAAGVGALATTEEATGDAAGLTVAPVDLDLVFDMRLSGKAQQGFSGDAPTQKVLPSSQP
jgi:hypothetical protein